MLKNLIAVLFFLVSFQNLVSSKQALEPEITCNPSIHNLDVVKLSVDYASNKLNKSNYNQNRLVVMILFSSGFSDSFRLPYLKCSLRKLLTNLAPYTPSDIFLWVPLIDSTENSTPAWLLSPEFLAVHVMPIPPDSYRIPCGLLPDAKWVKRKHFSVEYYLMGRWRLTFAVDFAKALGYQYYLQFDDDAMINNQINFNIVETFRNKSYLMGVFPDHIGEPLDLTLGLPELAKYWITIHKYNPRGTIFDHVKGHTLSNLNSDNWDRYYHPGYWLVLDLNHWFSEEVQSFVTLIMKTGRDVEGRWQEQMVQNFVRLIFVPKDQLWIMNEVNIGHDRHKRASFESWCVKSGFTLD